MAYTEVTETGWFGRIGRSIKGILFGFALLAISVFVLTMNERNAVKDIQANEEIGANVITVANDRIDPANEGKLVQFNGPAATDDVLKNKVFGIEENAIRLGWNAQIYQWEEDSDTKTEKKLGGGERQITTYTYRQKWSNERIDSSKFKEAGHDNKGGKEYQSGTVLAQNVTVGAFRLPQELIGQMSRSQEYPLAELPEALTEKGTLVGGVFYTGKPEAPEIGDEKVSFSITPPGDVSIMAVQKGDSLQAYLTKSGKTKFLLSDGLMTAAQMVKAEEEKAMILRWALRGVGGLLMFIGFCLLMGPLSVLADVIPFIGSIVGGATAFVSFFLTVGIGSIVVAVSWIAFRPMIGIPLFVVGGGCFVMLLAKGIMSKGLARSRS